METIDTNVAPAAPAESAPAQQQQVNEAPLADAPEGEAAPKADEPKAPSPRLQKRIDDLTRARYEAERRAAELESQLAQQHRQEQFQRQAAEVEAGKPRVNQFDSLEAWADAMTAWNSAKSKLEARAEWERFQQESNAQQMAAYQRAAAVAQQVERENAVLGDKFASAAQKFPDFQKVVGNPELPSVRGTAAYHAMLDSDHFAEISYHLAKNPLEYERVFSIADPIRATREIAKLEAQFAGNGATSAPPPPPVRANSSANQKDPGRMTTEEWMAWREGELKKQRRR